jgi:transcriptional regulator with XRE-family HTH domain
MDFNWIVSRLAGWGLGMTTLREERLRALLSIRQLARKASVSPTTIYLLESGQHSPQLLTIYKLSRALGVEPTEIDEFRAAIEVHRETAQSDEKERS